MLIVCLWIYVGHGELCTSLHSYADATLHRLKEVPASPFVLAKGNSRSGSHSQNTASKPSAGSHNVCKQHDSALPATPREAWPSHGFNTAAQSHASSKAGLVCVCVCLFGLGINIKYAYGEFGKMHAENTIWIGIIYFLVNTMWEASILKRLTSMQCTACMDCCMC